MVKEKPLSIKSRYPILTPLVLSVSVLSFCSPKIASMLVFDRDAVMQGEVWRLFSSYFVHFTNIQLVYNLLVFGIAGWIVEKKSQLHFSLLYLSMALVIGVTLFVLKPAMTYYGGLSGLACGFTFYCALLGIVESSPWRMISKLIIFLLPLKIFLELHNRVSILPYWGRQAFVIMPGSHLTGVIVALIFYFVLRYGREYWGQQPNLYQKGF